MLKFSDEVKIQVQSGNGGKGAVSFRREKNEPNGGPDGGNGGKGGCVYFSTQENLKTLTHIRTNSVYKAEKGQDGGESNKTGKDGKHIYIQIPPGTMVKDGKGNVLLDAVENNQNYLFLEGGKGGLGNNAFKTSINQAPYTFQEGEKGEVLDITLELNMIADIGFVGFPNAGKSSLLVALTKAKSEVAPYPFTTKIPHLGVLDIGYGRTVILADIPGLLEGASKGVGLGDKFLKHILRTQTLAFLIDLQENDYLKIYQTLQDELNSYSEEFSKKEKIIIGTKADLVELEKENEFLKIFEKEKKVIVISSQERYNLENLVKEFTELCYNNKKKSDW